MTFESEVRRGLDRISNNIKDLGTTLSSSRMPTGKAIEKAGKDISDASVLQSVDLLTDTEVEELRKLIELTSSDDFRGIEVDEDPCMRGMYEQFSDSGFVVAGKMMDGSLMVFSVLPKAYWAVERHKHKKEEETRRRTEEESRRKKDRRYGRMNIFLGAIFGYLFSLLVQATPKIIELISSLLPPTH